MKAVLIAAAAVAGVAAQNYPTFPLDWSAFVSQNLVENDGGVQQGSYYCCGQESPDCEIQVQAQSGQLYFAFTHNISAQFFADGSSIVSSWAYKAHKEYSVDRNGTCKEFCPLAGPFEPYNVVNSTDVGKVNINGEDLEGWQSLDVLPIFNITMEIDTVYVNQANMSDAFPVIEVDLLTPFGEQIGGANTTYTNWVAGTPPANKIQLPWNAAQCPKAKNCNQDVSRQLHRLAVKDKATFWQAYFAAKAERAAARSSQ